MAYKQDKWINGLQVVSIAYNTNWKNGFNTSPVYAFIFTEVQPQQLQLSARHTLAIWKHSSSPNQKFIDSTPQDTAM